MMNYYEDEPKSNNPNLSRFGKSQQIKESSGIIPVTSLILNQAEVTKEESVIYQGVPLNDINIVGYIMDFKEMESKMKISLCDYTGTIEIIFLNPDKNTDIIGMSKFLCDGKKKSVQIFGTVKVFKKEKIIQGAKILPVSNNNVLYHRTDVIYAWLYLTGKLNELKKNQMKNSAEEARNIAMKQLGDKDMKDAINLLNNYAKKNRKNDISHVDFNNMFQKYGENKEIVIDKLINNNKLIKTDYGYEIMS